MNLMNTPNIRFGYHLRGGSASLSIGTLAAECGLDKAQKCHRSGTEVIGMAPQVGYAKWVTRLDRKG
jgi:hypothetical protein